MKKILFPTDFSEVAANAFIYALELARILKAELVLLHNFELPIYDSQFFPANYSILFDSLQLAEFDVFKDEIPKLRALAEERKLSYIKMQHRLTDGNLLYNIKRVIEEEKIDFVVMGTSGATEWEAFILGTNTGNVLSAVTVPVLSVPLEAQFHQIETIGITTRFREKDKKALKDVLKIAKKANAKIKCLYVKTSNSDVLDATVKQWEEEFKQEPVQFSILLSEKVQETILDFIVSKSIDVLVMISYKKNFFVALFQTSLVHKFSNSLSIPILVLHE